MVKDAEAHAEEDKKFRELVEARNQADALVHAIEKSLNEHGDKVDGGEKAKIEAALSDLRGRAEGRRQGRDRGEDRGAGAGGREARREDVRRSSRQRGGGAGGAAGGGRRGGRQAAATTNVVDAEFEEVKDDKEG